MDVMQTLRTGRRGYIPDRSEIEEEYRWLGKPSPVSSFVKDYIYIYPHLVTPAGFVPYNSFGTWIPPAPILRSKEELWKALRNSHVLNYIPGLRLNYREYGLDEETAKTIREITSAK